MTCPGGRRGQLVLVAAATVAIAMVPLSLAYLQLGYHADVTAAGADATPARDAERILERSVHNASTSVDGEYAWDERERAVTAVNATLAPAVERLERSRLASGVGYAVERNASAATEHARTACPGGPDRRFGDCRERGGVVLQERAGETTVVAAGFDVHVVRERGTTDFTVVVPAVG